MDDSESPTSNAPISRVAENYNTSAYWFVIFTIIFFITRVVGIPSTILENTTSDNPGFNSFSDKIATIIYIFIVIMVMVYFNTDAIKKKCGEDANSGYLVFLTTFFPWLSIFGMLYTFLLVMPGWKSPFSNTFGYFIAIYFMNGKQKLLNLLNKTDDTKNDSLKLIIKDNASNIINDYGAENIGKLKDLHKMNNVFSPYENGNKQGQTNEQTRIKKIYNDVARLIIMKDYIAEFIWYILTGILVINMTTNFILEQNCV